MSDTDLLKRLYDRFNARDVEGVLEALHANVMWANGMEGGHVHGHDGVRNYWARQWAMIDPRVDPISFSVGSRDTTEVEVRQTVRNLEGNLISDKVVRHRFRIEDGLVMRFDIGSG